MLQPAGRRSARYTTQSALRRFFEIADAWELSPLQQCRLLKIPSPQVLERYRLGQAPRLSAVQQERAALVANIHYSLTTERGSTTEQGSTAEKRSAAGKRLMVDKGLTAEKGLTAQKGPAPGKRLTVERAGRDRAWAWVHGPQAGAPFRGDSPLYFMLEKGLPALREVARLLVRESEPR